MRDILCILVPDIDMAHAEIKFLETISWYPHNIRKTKRNKTSWRCAS